MSHLFAFNNAENMIAHPVPAGRYDAAQQLWIADEASYASMAPPEQGGGTYMTTASVTGDPTGWDMNCDIAYDW